MFRKFRDNLLFFPIHYFSAQPISDFLISENPEEVVLGILADFENQSPETVIQLILSRLTQLRGKDSELYRFVNQLRVLSQVRNLQPVTQNFIRKMIFNYNIQEDVVYLEGKQEGIQEGLKEGLKEKDEIATFNMLDKGFEPELISEILAVPPIEVLKLKKLWKLNQSMQELVKQGNTIKPAELAKILNVETSVVIKLMKLEQSRRISKK